MKLLKVYPPCSVDALYMLLIFGCNRERIPVSSFSSVVARESGNKYIGKNRKHSRGKSYVFIKTKRLTLKPYSDDDKAALIALLTDEVIKKTFVIPELRTEDEKTRIFEKLKAYSLSDGHYEAGIYLRDKLIGFINDVEITGNEIELGYVIAPEYQNRGYASEALSGAIADLFQRGFGEIIAGAFEDNAVSIKVMQNCGLNKLDRESEMECKGKIRRLRLLFYKKGSIRRTIPGGLCELLSSR